MQSSGSQPPTSKRCVSVSELTAYNRTQVAVAWTTQKIFFSHVRSLGVVNPGLVWLLLTIGDGGPVSFPAFACVVLLTWTPGLSSGQEKERDKNKRHILLTLSPFYLRRFPESSIFMCFYCFTWPFFFFFAIWLLCAWYCAKHSHVFILHNSPVWGLFTTPGLWFYPCCYIAKQSKITTFPLWPPVFSSVLWRTRLEKEFLKSPDPYRDHG